MSFKLWVGNISSTILCLQKRSVVLCEWHEMHWATVSQLEPTFLYIELWWCCQIHNMFRHGRPRYFNIQLIQIFLYRKGHLWLQNKKSSSSWRFFHRSFRISASTKKGLESHKWHTPRCTLWVFSASKKGDTAGRDHYGNHWMEWGHWLHRVTWLIFDPSSLRLRWTGDQTSTLLGWMVKHLNLWTYVYS